MPHSTSDPLRRHITRTYLSIRQGVILIAVALPFALWLVGRIADGHGLLGSMSDYYYYPTTRDIFVGALIAVGAILYFYKGFSRPEDWALNFAGLCIAGVAWVPMDPPGSPGRLLTWHGALAVLFFVCIAYVCMTRASDTLSLIRDTGEARRLQRIYRLLGVLMIVAPLAAAALGAILRNGDGGGSTVFFVEAVGVWVFAVYWLVKSHELKKTDASQLALDGKLKVTGQTSRPGRLIQVVPDDLTVSDWGSVVDVSD